MATGYTVLLSGQFFFFFFFFLLLVSATRLEKKKIRVLLKSHIPLVSTGLSLTATQTILDQIPIC